MMHGSFADSPSLSGVLSSTKKLNGTLSNAESLSGKFDGKLIRGASAYDIAVKHGYKGTEEEWIREMESNAVFCDSLPPWYSAKADTLYIVTGGGSSG